jgi:hypothetical protein
MSNEAVTYGRGGAGRSSLTNTWMLKADFRPGNVTTKGGKSPAFKPETTPTLKSQMYTTGRGGTGNMAKNEHPDEARRAQDVEVPGITLPEGIHHTGRGKLVEYQNMPHVGWID